MHIFLFLLSNSNMMLNQIGICEKNNNKLLDNSLVIKSVNLQKHSEKT